MEKLRIQIILGSTRSGRAGERVGRWIETEAKKREDFDIDYVDLKDIELPFFDEPVSPAYNGGTYVNPVAAQWAERVGKADGFIFITPEYNHSFPAVLKNAIDYVYHEWTNKAAGIVSYSVGPWGGVRATQSLRDVLTEIQIAPIRASVHIPFVTTALSEDGIPNEERLSNSTTPFFDNLAKWSRAMKSIRE